MVVPARSSAIVWAQVKISVALILLRRTADLRSPFGQACPDRAREGAVSARETLRRGLRTGAAVQRPRRVRRLPGCCSPAPSSWRSTGAVLLASSESCPESGTRLESSGSTDVSVGDFAGDPVPSCPGAGWSTVSGCPGVSPWYHPRTTRRLRPLSARAYCCCFDDDSGAPPIAETPRVWRRS